MSAKAKKTIFMVFLLAALVTIPFSTAYADATTLTGADIEQAIYQTVDYYRGQGQPADEWVVVALNAVGEDLNKTPYLAYDGDSFNDDFELPSEPTINEYASAILAYLSIGEDDKADDIVAEMADCDMDDIGYISTAAYALMALDAAGASSGSDSINREGLISYILYNKIGDDEIAWGYYWEGYGYIKDVDTTAEMIAALAPYYGRAEVKSSVDTALDWLEEQDFSANSSSITQVICALTALGIDPQTWQATNMVDSLLDFQLGDGQFSFFGSASDMSTYQALTALAAEDRFIAGDGANIYIYQDIAYQPKNVVTLRIEDASATVMAKRLLHIPLGATLADVVGLAIEQKYLTDIEVDGDDIVNPGSGDIYHAVINDSYLEDDAAAGSEIAAGDDIVLYTGASGVRLGRLTLTNSIDNANDLVSPEDYITATVEALDGDGDWSLVSGATVYADSNAVGTTDSDGQVTFNISSTGAHQIWSKSLDLDGDLTLVTTISKTVSVSENVAISFRMEGNLSTGTIVPQMSLEVPDGCSTIFAVKRALDLAGIANTIDINYYITESDITLPGDISSPGYMYYVNDSLDWTQTVGSGDSVALYMSYYDLSTWAAITSYARISADKPQINPGDTVTLTVEKSDNDWYAPSYVPAAGAEVYIDGERLENGEGEPILTDSSGQVQVTLDEAKKYHIYAQQFDEDGVPLIVKTGVITVSADLKIEFIDVPASFAPGSDADLTVKINNASAEDITGLLIVALYNTDTKKMVNYSYVSQTVAASGSAQFTAGFAIPVSGHYQVRVFVWDGWESAIPLTNSLTIPVEEE